MLDKKNLIYRNKELFWDISDFNKLGDEALEEKFLMYWDWKNILDLIDILGYEKFRNIYLKLKNKPRCSFSRKTINFFNLYLNV